MVDAPAAGTAGCALTGPLTGIFRLSFSWVASVASRAHLGPEFTGWAASGGVGRRAAAYRLPRDHPSRARAFAPLSAVV
jgi:hypothetical protein